VLFPVSGCGDMDEVDVFGTFTSNEAKKLGIIPYGAMNASPTKPGSIDEKVSD
jgi:hypothetical protein